MNVPGSKTSVLAGAIALLLALLCLTAFEFLERMADDAYKSADDVISRTWTVSDTPTVVVATFCGSVYVHPGDPRTVRIEVELHSSCKNKSLTDAERSLTAIDVQADQKGDAIRILAKRVGDPVQLCAVEASAHVYIPPGTRLAVETSAGSISIAGAPSEIVAKNRFGAFAADFVIGPRRSAELTGEADAKLAVVRSFLYVDGQAPRK